MPKSNKRSEKSKKRNKKTMRGGKEPKEAKEGEDHHVIQEGLFMTPKEVADYEQNKRPYSITSVDSRDSDLNYLMPPDKDTKYYKKNSITNLNDYENIHEIRNHNKNKYKTTSGRQNKISENDIERYITHKKNPWVLGGLSLVVGAIIGSIYLEKSLKKN
jgi:hypothetical protein